MTFPPGHEILWLRTPRGGYGLTTPVPATIVRYSTKRVLIRALLKDGTTKDVWVKTSAIVPK